MIVLGKRNPQYMNQSHVADGFSARGFCYYGALSKVIVQPVFDLTEVDLLHASNFKGGNASICEPLDTLREKLGVYSKILHEIGDRFGGRTSRYRQNGRGQSDHGGWHCGFRGSSGSGD